MSDGPRVLLVDDNAFMRDALRVLIEGRGWSVVGEAPSGEEGLAAALRTDPDVVLMDLKMPGIGGIEATARLHEELPEAQVVIVTAYADPALREAAPTAFAYLVKGCPSALIVDTIEKAWRHRTDLKVKSPQ